MLERWCNKVTAKFILFSRKKPVARGWCLKDILWCYLTENLNEYLGIAFNTLFFVWSLRSPDKRTQDHTNLGRYLMHLPCIHFATTVWKSKQKSDFEKIYFKILIIFEGEFAFQMYLKTFLWIQWICSKYVDSASGSYLYANRKIRVLQYTSQNLIFEKINFKKCSKFLEKTILRVIFLCRSKFFYASSDYDSRYVEGAPEPHLYSY